MDFSYHFGKIDKIHKQPHCRYEETKGLHFYHYAISEQNPTKLFQRQAARLKP